MQVAKSGHARVRVHGLCAFHLHEPCNLRRSSRLEIIDPKALTIGNSDPRTLHVMKVLLFIKNNRAGTRAAVPAEEARQATQYKELIAHMD